jgi:antitoxin VapB
MAISIKDPKTDELARRISSMTGETITEAIFHSLEFRLKTLESLKDDSISMERIKVIQNQVRKKISKGSHSLDHGDILYDKNGLPK